MSSISKSRAARDDRHTVLPNLTSLLNTTACVPDLLLCGWGGERGPGVCGKDDRSVPLLHSDGDSCTESSSDLQGCQHCSEVLTGEGDLVKEKGGAVGISSHGVDAEGEESSVLKLGESFILGVLAVSSFVGSC